MKHVEQAKNCGIKIDYKDCASRWSLTHYSFLHVAISKADHNVSFNVYIKPTATDVVIPNESRQPPEQKLAAVRYLINRLLSYPMNGAKKREEYDTVRQILHNNKYDVKILNKITCTIDTQQ